jgi:hypothetical protein
MLELPTQQMTLKDGAVDIVSMPKPALRGSQLPETDRQRQSFRGKLGTNKGSKVSEDSGLIQTYKCQEIKDDQRGPKGCSPGEKGCCCLLCSAKNSRTNRRPSSASYDALFSLTKMIGFQLMSLHCFLRAIRWQVVSHQHVSYHTYSTGNSYVDGVVVKKEGFEESSIFSRAAILRTLTL